MELRSSRWACSEDTARQRSLAFSGSLGIMTAKCQRNSCSLVSVIKPSSSFLWGRSSSRFLRVIFSAASAARIRTRGSADHRPAISLGNNRGFFDTIVTTLTERPIERRSPPCRRARMFLDGMRGARSKRIQRLQLVAISPTCSWRLKEAHDDIWLVSFMDYDLGYFDLETRVLEPLENPFGPKVLPMS